MSVPDFSRLFRFQSIVAFHCHADAEGRGRRAEDPSQRSTASWGVRRGSREDLFPTVEMGLTNSGPSKIHCCVLFPSWVMEAAKGLNQSHEEVLREVRPWQHLPSTRKDLLAPVRGPGRVLESAKPPWSEKSTYAAVPRWLLSTLKTGQKVERSFLGGEETPTRTTNLSS